MKKRWKRMIACVVVILLLFQDVLVYATTEKRDISKANVGNAIINNNVQTKGTNSFGNLVTAEFEKEAEKQKESSGFNVLEIVIEGKEASVSFETLENCTLVVAIYDESGKNMKAIGSKEVQAGETETKVSIEIETMPDYFYLKGYLIDSDSLRPLCTAYESPNYTWEMQKFLSKTSEDFEPDKVINLDEDITNNFLVCEEDTKIIPQSETTNQVVSVDEEAGIYRIENAESSITSLQGGDIFVYPYSEGEMLIVKVASISVDGTTVTIVGDKTSLEEAFAYVRLEGEALTEDGNIDENSYGEGVSDASQETEVVKEWNAADGIGCENNKLEIDEKLEKKRTVNVDFMKKGNDNLNIKISGKVSTAFSVDLKLYITETKKYLQFKIDYEKTVNLSVAGKISFKHRLFTIGFIPVPGVIIELNPSLVFSTEAGANIEASITGTVGFSVDGEKGMKSLTTLPKCVVEMQGEVSVFLGVSLEPRIKIICDAIVTVGLEAEVGGEIKAVMTIEEIIEDKEKKHDCKKCINGDVNGKISVVIEAELLKTIKFKNQLLGFKKKVGDFYYSYDYDEYGKGVCPHLTFKTVVTVTDKDDKPIAGAIVSENGEQKETNDKGNATFWLVHGEHIFDIKKEGYSTFTKRIEIDEEGTKVEITLLKNGQSDSTEEEIVEYQGEKHRLSMGGFHSGVIMEDGSLYMWGDNSSGQLGDGTTGMKTTPVKVLDKVVSVSLGGYHSAAITENGNLYMWGNNEYGQLGDGSCSNRTTPVLVLENVIAVSLGYNHSAAITKNGSLYMWGNNEHGQLGTGRHASCSTPLKIMSHVRGIELGGDQSGAINNDGTLYMWGENSFGQLGDGTTEDKSLPVAILENVKSFSIGNDHCGAISEENSLYMWGENGSGQLGIEGVEKQIVPKKIMDNITVVELNGDTSCILKENGTLLSCGLNKNGQCGIGSRENIATFTEIMKNVECVALGLYHCGVLTEDGSLYMWGANGFGQLGDDTAICSTPRKIMDNAVSLSMQLVHSGVVTKDGSLYMWGDNSYGQLGDGTNIDRETPVKIMDSVASIVLGERFSAAITKDGGLYTWGDNSYGQLGDGTQVNKNTPVRVLEHVKTVSVGENFCGAITEDGSLYMWGNNTYGQVGNGTNDGEIERTWGGEEKVQITPVKVLEKIDKLSLGDEMSAAVSEDGSLYIWGRNYDDRVEISYSGTTKYYNHKYTIREKPEKMELKNVVGIYVNDDTGAVITGYGSLYLWGCGTLGELTGEYENYLDLLWGSSAWTHVNSPKKVELSGVNQVSMMAGQCSAVTNDGTMYVWGEDTYVFYGYGHYGTSVVKKKMENVVAVKGKAPGSVTRGGEKLTLHKIHSAITNDGSLYMWGENYFGQLGNGTTERQTVPQKILDKVISVDYNLTESGAITEDGSLYTWGSHFFCEGATDKLTPISISLSTGRRSGTSEEFNNRTTIVNPNTSIYVAEKSGTSAGQKIYTNLKANSVYNFYVMKSRAVENLLSSENLLYISQVKTDGDGDVTINYGLKEDVENAYAFVVCAELCDIGDAEIDVKNLQYNGEEQFVQLTVTYDGKILKEGTDYELSGEFSGTNSGEYIAFVNGIGMYTGKQEITYRIEAYKAGDVNGDGNITAEDALAVLKFVVGIQQEEFNSEVADCNNDGNITAEDALAVLKHVVGLAPLT